MSFVRQVCSELVPAALMLACSGASGSPRAFRAVVVVNSAQYGSMPRIRLSTLITICSQAVGDADSGAASPQTNPHCPFHDLTAGARSPTGSVAIAAKGIPVQYFDSAGRRIRELGEIGNGRAQYAGADAIRFDGHGDLRLLDLTNFRLLTIDTTGHLRSSVQLEAPPQFADAQLGPDGVVFLSLPAGKALGDPVTATLAHVDSLGRLTRTTTKVTATAMWVSGVDMQPAKPFFLAKPVWGVGHAQSVVYSTADDAIVECYDSAGNARLQIRIAMPLLRVTAADIANETARELAGFSTPAWRARARPFIRRAARAARSTHAAFTRLTVMADSSIWLRESAENDADSARWDSFRPDGRPLGFTMLPAADAILGGTSRRLLLERGESQDRYVIIASASPLSYSASH